MEKVTERKLLGKPRRLPKSEVHADAFNDDQNDQHGMEQVKSVVHKSSVFLDPAVGEKDDMERTRGRGDGTTIIKRRIPALPKLDSEDGTEVGPSNVDLAESRLNTSSGSMDELPLPPSLPFGSMSVQRPARNHVASESVRFDKPPVPSTTRKDPTYMPPEATIRYAPGELPPLLPERDTPFVTERKHKRTPTVAIHEAIPMPNMQKKWTDDAPIEIKVGSALEVDGVQYRILREIGKGGTSAVYCAMRDVPDGKDALVALKHVTGVEHVDALKEEIKLLERLRNNPYVIQIFAYAFWQNVGVLIMELGSTDINKCVEELTTDISTGKRDVIISRNTIRHYFEGMVEAVRAIHECRIIHGDLKPANFVLVRGRIKLIDFGIAKAINENTINITRDNQTGTINYIPPEALSANSDNKYKLNVKADVWSLGCILYYFIHGRAPFAHVSPLHRRMLAIMDPKFDVPFPPIEPEDPALQDVLRRCLQRDVSMRIGILELLQHPFLSHRVSSIPVSLSQNSDAVSSLALVHTAHELALRSGDVHMFVNGSSMRANEFAKAFTMNLMSGTNLSVAIEMALETAATKSKVASTRKPMLKVRHDIPSITDENAFHLHASTPRQAGC